jgi:hypothetical protein
MIFKEITVIKLSVIGREYQGSKKGEEPQMIKENEVQKDTTMKKRAHEISMILNREYSHILDEQKKFEVNPDADSNTFEVIRKDERSGGERYRIADIDLNTKTISVYYKHYFDIFKDFSKNHIFMDSL